MLRPALRAAVVALAALVARVDAAVTLELRVDSQVRSDLAVHVGVKNVGDEPALDAWPEVRLLDTSVRGTGERELPPTFEATWHLSLPRPSALGTFPLVVQLHYGDAFGHRTSAPAVHLVRTAGTPALDVGLSVTTQPLTSSAEATARIENREATTLAGTLHAITTVDLAVTPAERPIEVAPNSTLVVPLRVESRGAPPESTGALWVYATLPRGAWTEALAAQVAVPIVSAVAEETTGPGIVLPIAIIVAVGCAIWGARRLLAPARPGATRAERRREH
jgi:GAF domain-containing protein